MPESDNHHIAQLSRSDWIDQVADQFDAAWRTGTDAPVIQDFLGSASGAIRRDLIIELVAVDREYRAKRGMPKSWEQYAAEIPELPEDPQLQYFIAGTTQLPTDLHQTPLQGRAADERKPVNRCVVPAVLADHIGKYQILKELGRGMQATAYLCFDPDLAKNVVLKISHETVTPGDEDRLRAEGRVLAELSESHLVRVLHYDLHERRPYLVMEYVAGQNLAQWAGAARPPQRVALLLVAQIAQALESAHRRGIIHRDIKPSNVLIDVHGNPRMIDFGLALHRHGWNESDARTSEIAGTIAFMPPEQARGELDRVGPRSDVFGLAAVLFYLLTGEAPFMKKGERDLLKVLNRSSTCDFDRSLLRRSGVTPKLEEVCHRAMAAKPEDRFATAAEFETALLALYHAGRATRRQALIVGTTAAAGVVAASYFFLRRAPMPAIEPPKLVLRVWRDGQPVADWVDATPLLSDRDELQLRWNFPRPLATDLYLINGRGELQSLVRSIPTDGSEQAFPALTERAPLVGPTGTEAILLCARRTGTQQPKVDWNDSAPWPALGKGTTLRLTSSGFDTLQGSRDLGAAHSSEGPEEVVRRRLQTLQESMAKYYHYFEAVVFTHH